MTMLARCCGMCERKNCALDYLNIKFIQIEMPDWIRIQMEQ